MGRLSAKKATEKEKYYGLAKALNPNRKEVAYPRTPIVVATLVILPPPLKRHIRRPKEEYIYNRIIPKRYKSIYINY